MTRRETNDALVRWVTERAASHGGIGLLALYGSYLNGTAGERSDIDVYYIPADDGARETARDFSRTFILDGVGYDIYPRSWENLASIASMENFMTPCLADVQVLYGTNAARGGWHPCRRRCGQISPMRRTAGRSPKSGSPRRCAMQTRRDIC